MKTVVYVVALIASLFLCLEVLPYALNVPEYIFPRASVVGAEILENANPLAKHALVTLAEAIIGLILAFFVSSVVVIMAARIDWDTKAPDVLAVALQTIPVVAIAPLAIIWFGPGLWSKAFMAAMIACPPLLVAQSQALRATPAGIVDLYRVMGWSNSKILFKLRIPFAAQAAFVGLRIAAGLAIIGAIVAEYAGARSGVGYMIMQSSYRLNVPLTFGSVYVAIFSGMMLVLAVKLFNIAVNRVITRR